MLDVDDKVVVLSSLHSECTGNNGVNVIAVFAAYLSSQIDSNSKCINLPRLLTVFCLLMYSVGTSKSKLSWF